MRVYILDYLRGLSACLILIYHGLSWIFELHNPLLLFIGRYGVICFFVISGYSLSIGYKSRITNHSEFTTYIWRRFLRIYPLFLVVTIVTILGQFLFGNSINIFSIITNVIFVFPFLGADTAIASGAWSIADEWIFYLFLPLFLRASKSLLARTLTILIFISSWVYFFNTVTPNLGIDHQWGAYVHWLGQIRWFLLGVFLPEITLRKFCSTKLLFFMSSCLLLFFIFFSFIDPTFNLISGISGFIVQIFFLLYISTLIIEFREYNADAWLHKLLDFFAKISYGIYLVHPLVYYLLRYLDFESKYNLFITLVFTTFLLARLSWHFIEKPLLRFK